MPIYEYQCDKCSDKFEVKQSMKDAALTICPRCGMKIQRLISSTAIMFKGSGWYVTDYSDKMKPSSNKDGGSPTVEGSKETVPNTPSPAPSTPATTPAALATTAAPASVTPTTPSASTATSPAPPVK